MSTRKVMIFVPTLVGQKKGFKTSHSNLRDVRKAKKQRRPEEYSRVRSNLQELFLLFTSLFPNSFIPWNLFCTLACSYFSPSGMAPAKDIKLFQLYPPLWNSETTFPPRECVWFPIFSIALTELVVDAYQKHFSTLYQICAHLRAALELSAQRAGLRL